MSENPLGPHLHQPALLVPHNHDVLFGRGALINKHPGNHWYRRLVYANRGLYNICEKHDKLIVAKNIVQMVHLRNPPGRFLQKEHSAGVWIPVPNEKAVRKTSQALRERRILKDQGQRNDMVSCLQNSSAALAQELLGGTSGEAKASRAEQRSIQMQSGASGIELRSLHQTSLSVRIVGENPTMEDYADRILLPSEPQSGRPFNTNSMTLKDTALRQLALTPMSRTLYQIALNGCDGFQGKTSVQSEIDLSVESSELLQLDERLFRRDLEAGSHMLTHQHEAKFSGKGSNAIDLQPTSVGKRSRDIFEIPGTSVTPGVETTVPLSVSISSKVWPPFVPCSVPLYTDSRPNSAAPCDQSRETICGMRIRNINSKVHRLALPHGALPVRRSFSSQEIEVSHNLYPLSHDKSYFSTNTTLSDATDVEPTNSTMFVPYPSNRSSFSHRSGLAVPKGGMDQHMEGMQRPTLDDSDKVSLQEISALCSNPLDLDIERRVDDATNLLLHADAKRGPDDVDDLASGYNPGEEYDCASTFGSIDNANETSLIGDGEGMVNKADSTLVSGDISGNLSFDAFD